MSLTDVRTHLDIAETDMFARDKPLVCAVRGGLIECVHRGSAAVCDTEGRLRWFVGNPDERVFLRSGAKPFQAMAAVLAGAVERFGLTPRELAVMASSHSAEPHHLDAIRSLLSKIGLSEAYLQCGVHPPINIDAAADLWRRGEEPSQLCNNCSGSHAGLLAACVAAEWSTERYGDPDHPVQSRIRGILAAFADLDRSAIPEAIDNCAVPTFRLSLKSAATAFARLATGNGLPSDLAPAAMRVRDAMTLHPDLVGGEGRFDSDLMVAGAGTLISKGGADGFQGVGLIGEALGIALKMSAGNGPAATVATCALLAQLRAIEPSTLPILEQYHEPNTVNLRGAVVGGYRSVFALRASK